MTCHPLAALLLVIATAAPATAQLGIRSELYVASGLTEPLYATAPQGDSRLFVVERAGRIRIVQNGVVTGTFLNITSKVSTAGEGGLLGLAFDPDYASNGFFYVYYTDTNVDSVLSRFSVSANPDVASTTETEILFVDQPSTANHKGGTIAFGPDGFLYWGLGDGGGSYDPQERAQNLEDLLGKMLRLDVGVPPQPGSLPVAGQGYAIPAGNPFLGVAGRDEIWSLGLRNPYRWSFDRENGEMWIADVGQGQREEVDFEPADDPGGRNWGWDVMEGTLCTAIANDPAPSPPCNAPSLTLPVAQYSHTGGRCSITGGFVYRGSQVPAAHDLYFFADYCTGEVWTLDPDTLLVENVSADLGAAALQTGNIAGFGEDGSGELYILHRGSGRVYKLASAGACSDGLDNDGDGATDFPADAGCMDLAGWSEDPGCNDGVDNDRDGRIDFPADPHCMAGWDPAEKGGCGPGAMAGAVFAPLALGLGRGARRVRRLVTGR